MTDPDKRTRVPVRVVNYPTDTVSTVSAPPPPEPRAGVIAKLRRSRLAMLGLGILVAMVILAVFARPISLSAFGYRLTVQPIALAPYSPDALFVGAPHEGPSLAHPFGTDWAGRDLFSRVLVGGRVSLSIGVLATVSALGIGVPIGALAGAAGGWVDEGLMRLVDVLYAFPFLVLAIALVAIIGPGFWNIVLALALVGWVGYARLIRGEILAIRDREYVLAARAIGGSRWTILTRHLLPNAIGPVIVQATLGIGSIVLAGAALGFLGLGLEPASAEWGALLARSRATLLQGHWHVTLFPGLAIFWFVLAVNLVGDAISDALDPHDRSDGRRMR